ncbi:MAG: type II toxin-antitoxin system RelE/ParE family toxin [Geminicoccaceae bacterium]
MSHRGLPPDQVKRLTSMLTLLDQAEEPEDIDLFPGWRLHRLKGDLKGFWSLTVTGNWRFVFRMQGGNAFDVDLLDYH